MNSTLLHRAVKANDVDEAWRLILAEGVDVTVADDDGYTPLHLAMGIEDSVEIARMLLYKSASTSVLTKSGDSPLFLAVKNNNVKAVRLLLDNGANANESDKTGVTPLHICVHEEITEYLLRNRANPMVKDSFNDTPLHYAVVSNNLQKVDILLSKGAKIDAMNSKNETPYSLASKHADGRILNLFDIQLNKSKK